MPGSSKSDNGEAVKAAAAASHESTDRRADKGEASKPGKGKTENAEVDAASSAAASPVEAHAAEPSVSEPAAPEPVARTVSEPAPAGKATPSRKAGFKSGSKAETSVEPKPSIKELKEKIMATNPNYTNVMTDAVAELQDRSKAAFDKSTELMTEMSEFAKGTVEAMVESGKIFSGSVQDMGKTYAEEAKSAYELMTADLKEIAAVKSPTELFQLQGKIMRRNFDAVVSTTSKNAEKVMKLSNDVFAPLSARMNVAAEKMSKVA